MKREEMLTKDVITTTDEVEKKIFSKLHIKNAEDIDSINVPLRLVLDCLDEIKEEAIEKETNLNTQ